MDKTCNTKITEEDKEDRECQQLYKMSKPLNKKDTKVETDTSESGSNRNRHGKPSVSHLHFHEIPYLAQQLALYPSEYEAISIFDKHFYQVWKIPLRRAVLVTSIRNTRRLSAISVRPSHCS